MSYKAQFNGWGSITIEDLLVAYRKAKADCFFENTFPAAIKFAEYEQDLLTHLNALSNQLKSDAGFEDNKTLLGDFRLLPKKLSTARKPSTGENGHVHFSKPEKAVESLFRNYEITPEFRIVGDFPVDTHIISALWINMIGHQFDAKFDDSCYGARLKRILNDELFTDGDERPFHISSIGSFVPYFQPYQKWRSDGLKAIRDELEKDRDIIAVSLDLKCYYHFIDPLAISGKDLLAALELKLTDEEKAFTKQLSKFLSNWAEGAEKFGQMVGGKRAKISGGLVIGLTCSRIISNALLYKWDRLVMEKLSPIHYGRYVDDMFLVLRDTGTVSSSLDLMNLIQARMGENVISQNARKKVWEINQGENIQGNSKISLQSDKQKLFILQGRAGLDLLDSIEKEIYELSSEHRLMPSPDQLEHSTAAKVLSAAGSVGENADTLRRADGLTIRRLGWSLQLRHVETLARDLPPNQWKEQREEFYQFAHNHILRADNLFAHFNYLPRLLGFAISMNEWEQAEQIAVKSYRAIDTLAYEVSKGKRVRINGSNAKVLRDLWDYIKGTLTWLFVDAATRYHDPSKLFLGERSSKKKRLADLFLNQIVITLTDFGALLNLRFDVADFERKAPLVAAADLAKDAYKYILNSPSAEKLAGKRNAKKENRILKLLGNSDLLDVDVFEQFINSTRKTRLGMVTKGQKINDSYLPYLFPTRPLSPAEISELAPECVGLPSASGKLPIFGPAVTWAKYTQVLRGVWIKPTLLAAEQDANDKKSKQRKKYLKIGTDSKEKVVVALTNLRTEDTDWAATACNKPNLSRKRYQKISKLVNDVLKLNPKPDYVIFPELSIPLRWLNSIAGRLSAAGISLIAGTEYRHKDGNKILSEAALILADNRLGYPAFVKIWQPKLEPAVGEDKELTVKYGKEWDIPEKALKPIYIHNGFNFGVMVCSELQNSKARIRFQGAVDALMVLSWNRDLDTFSSLIESAALDVHAYTILVNNRKYGDSRVRSPAKENFLRDIARLRGGDNDFVVAATLDIGALRTFQSRAKRWPEEGDKFKPVPEGFITLDGRRKLPPE